MSCSALLGHSSKPTSHGGNRRYFMPLPHGLSSVRRARYTQHRPTPKGVAGFECRTAKRERATTSPSTGSSSASNSTASHSTMCSSLRGKLQLALHTIDYTHTHTTLRRARVFVPFIPFWGKVTRSPVGVLLWSGDAAPRSQPIRNHFAISTYCACAACTSSFGTVPCGLQAIRPDSRHLVSWTALLFSSPIPLAGLLCAVRITYHLSHDADQGAAVCQMSDVSALLQGLALLDRLRIRIRLRPSSPPQTTKTAKPIGARGPGVVFSVFSVRVLSIAVRLVSVALSR
jgi:hypothetical protein